MQKSFTSSARSILVVSIAIWLASAIGCGSSKPEPPSASEATKVEATTGLTATEEDRPAVMGKVPAFQLTDQHGQTFDSQSLAGKLWVANFFFSTCPSTCPKQSAEIKKLQDSKLAEAYGIQFVSITVQPEVDTPATLARYASQFEADPQRWHFLTGERNAIWELSKKHFFMPVGDAPKASEMPIFHSSKLILVDEAMQIRGFFESQSPAGISDLKQQLTKLAAVTALTSQEAGGSTATAESKDDDSPSVSDLVDAAADDGGGAFANVGRKEDTGQIKNIYAPSRSQVLVPWLADRASKQQATTGQFDVYHKFRFSDQRESSGIDFVNHVVDDAAKNYTAAHYDHGNGVAIADIDGDGLHDLYFTNQIGANGLFRNLGNGKFANVTEASGVGLADRVSVTASFADYDNDGDADLFVTTVRHGNAMFQNDGNGKFTDVTKPAGLEYVGHSSASVFFDYDRDGWLDLFVTNVGKYTTEEVGPGNYYKSLPTAFSGHLQPELAETSRLYRNVDGKSFEDMTEKVGLVDGSWSGAASPVDANDDGWPDLYVLDMQGHDEYFENVDGKRFVKKSRELFPRTSWGAMGIKVFDFDNDGRFDIYISDMHSDMSELVDIDHEKEKSNMQWPESMLQTNGTSVWGNSLFHKQADGSYVEASDKYNAENYWPWGLSVGDLNADGYDDVFLASSMNLPFRYAVNSVFLNNNGERFLDSEFILGVEPRAGYRTAKPWFTLDCDGPDKEHQYAKAYKMTSGKAVVWGTLGSRSSVIFDYDNDGDLDIITNDFHSEPMVLESDLADRKKINFLKVKLVGKKSNRDGLGSVVTVTRGGKSFAKVHDGISGYLSQSRDELYFGLGDSKQIDSISITWPSGKKQTLPATDGINQTVTIREP